MRAATPDDGEPIARIQIRTWQAAYAHVFPAEALAGLSAQAEARARFWRGTIETAPARRRVVVAERGGDVFGFASVGPARAGDVVLEEVGELYAIYVEPEFWGGGAGRALMAEALGALRRGAFSEAILWVLEDNPRTRRFYELCGWEADGGTKDEEWLGSLVREVRYRISLERLG